MNSWIFRERMGKGAFLWLTRARPSMAAISACWHFRSLHLHRRLPPPPSREWEIGCPWNSNGSEFLGFHVIPGILYTEFCQISRNSTKVKTNSKKIPASAELQKLNSVDTYSGEIYCMYIDYSTYVLCPTAGCGPSRPLQLASVKFEDSMNVCLWAVVLYSF
jgi:hypothetical protein